MRGAPGTPGASAAYTLAAGLSTAVGGSGGRAAVALGGWVPVPGRPPSTRLGAAGTCPSHVPRQHRSLFCSKPCARRWETSDGEGEAGRRPSPSERGRPPLDSCASIRKNKAGTGPRFDGAYANVLLKRGRGGARREIPGSPPPAVGPPGAGGRTHRRPLLRVPPWLSQVPGGSFGLQNVLAVAATPPNARFHSEHRKHVRDASRGFSVAVRDTVGWRWLWKSKVLSPSTGGGGGFMPRFQSPRQDRRPWSPCVWPCEGTEQDVSLASE